MRCKQIIGYTIGFLMVCRVLYCQKFINCYCGVGGVWLGGVSGGVWSGVCGWGWGGGGGGGGVGGGGGGWGVDYYHQVIWVYLLIVVLMLDVLCS